MARLSGYGLVAFASGLQSENCLLEVNGVGQSGFRPQGDSSKWAMLIVWRDEPKVNRWWQKWMKAKSEIKLFYLRPLFGHGLWDAVDSFAPYIATSTPSSRIAVLTRVSIRWNKVKLF